MLLHGIFEVFLSPPNAIIQTHGTEVEFSQKNYEEPTNIIYGSVLKY